MLYIFKKKQFLKDLLEDFVDIHCHILPGIDDGAKSIEESLLLIKKMQALGFKQCIATPHIMSDFYPNTEVTIGNAYQNLITELRKNKLNHIIINPAAEYMMDAHFETLVTQNNLFPLKENYVLVEMSYFQPPIHLEETLHKLILKNYIPVLAHPERYVFYHQRKTYLKALKNMGCKFQLNMLSLTEHYGKSTKTMAKYLLEEQLIDFVASDIHHENHIEQIHNIVLDKKEKQQLSKIIETTKNTFLLS